MTKKEKQVIIDISNSLINRGAHSQGNDEIRDLFNQLFKKIDSKSYKLVKHEIFTHVKVNLFLHERSMQLKKFNNHQISTEQLVEHWYQRLSKTRTHKGSLLQDHYFLYIYEQSLMEKRVLFESKRIRAFGQDKDCYSRFTNMISNYYNKLNNHGLRIINESIENGISADDISYTLLKGTRTVVVQVPGLSIPLYVNKTLVDDILGVKYYPVKRAKSRHEKIYVGLDKFQHFSLAGIAL